MSTIRKESSAAAKFFADLGRHKKRKKKEKKTSTATSTVQSVVTSTQPVSKTPKATDVYQPHTLNKSGKPTRDLTYKYDRSIFGDYRDDNYVDLRKTLKLRQTPDPNTTTSTTVLGSTTITKVTTSGEKRFPLSVTTGEEIKGRSEIDHRWPISAIARGITPVSQFAPEFVKKKWKVREDGTRQLSAKQLSDIHADPKNTQLLSEAENQAKGSKVLSEYTKEGGWGTETEPQTKDPVYQAESYHDALVDAAKKFGKKGLMSREDAQAYTEITGKQPDPILDSSNPNYSPPSTKQNITGLDKPGEARKARAAAKKAERNKAWAEYGGEKPTEEPRQGYILSGKSAKEIKSEKALAKEHGKQLFRLGSMIQPYKPKSQVLNRLAPKAKDQGSPNLKSDPQFSYIQSESDRGLTVKQQKEYDKSPEGRGYEKVDGKWQKIQKKSKITSGIQGVKLVKNTKGYWVTPRVLDAEKKRKAQAAKDLIINESWM